MTRLTPFAIAVVIVMSVVPLSTLTPAGGTLDIYWIDVEGGAATLIITPARESILMDAGWDRPDNRDAQRIRDAMVDARIDRIDYFLASHFHADHVGGLSALAALVEIGQFIDHGDSVEQDTERGRATWESYRRLAQGRRRTVTPGDKLPFARLEFTFVTANGQTLDRPLLPLGPNPYCEGSSSGPDDVGENSRSLGYLLSLGAFQFLNLGDLTTNVQHAIACPENKLGTVDIYQVPHHGNGVASQLTWAVTPSVAVINNGPHKGGSADGFNVVAQTPGLDQIWQTHRALDSGEAHNADEAFLANTTDEAQCRGYWIKAIVAPDGRSYSLVNGRNDNARAYLSR